MNKKSLAIYVATALGVGIASPAAATIAITFTGGTPTGVFFDRTFGYDFTVGAQSITIDGLGFWDQDGDGLFEDHQVGIWSSDGSTLLASTIISAGTGATLDSGFRFSTIAALTLDANVNYLIGAFNGTTGNDQVTRFATATVDPRITLGSTRFDQTFDGVFGPPTGTQGDSFDDGYFGPNFQIAAMGAIPEPTTWALMIFGFGAIGGAMRRQRKPLVKVSYA